MCTWLLNENGMKYLNKLDLAFCCVVSVFGVKYRHGNHPIQIIDFKLMLNKHIYVFILVQALTNRPYSFINLKNTFEMYSLFQCFQNYSFSVLEYVVSVTDRWITLGI